MLEIAPMLLCLILHMELTEFDLPKSFLDGQCATATTFGTPRCLSGDSASIMAVCDLSRISHPRTHPQLRMLPT